MGGLRGFIRKYWFLLGMAAAAGLAYGGADLGGRMGHFEAVIGGVSNAAIIALFLIAGIAISLSNVGREMGNIRLHLFVQGFVYLFIPALVFATSFWIPAGRMKEGVYLLAVLPTTISTCVAFTAAARGNTLGALLNAVGSNMLGIVASPLLVGLMIGVGGSIPPGAVGKLILNMVLVVFVPFVVGQAIAACFGRVRERLRGVQSLMSQLLVLVLSYCAFTKSITKLADQRGAAWQVFAYLAAVQVVLILLATLLARGAGLKRDDRSAAIFCSTQKTMAFGVPISLALGIEILPLVFYYLFQMLTASLFLHAWNRRQRA